MSEETLFGDAVADTQAAEPSAEPASPAPKKRGRPRKNPLPATADAAASATAPEASEEIAAASVNANANAVVADAPPPPAFERPAAPAPAESPAANATLPAFEIAGDDADTNAASSNGRIGDAVVFDPRSILEQFGNAAASASASTSAAAPAPARAEPEPPAYVPPAFEQPAFVPPAVRQDSPRAASAASANDEDRASAEELAQFSSDGSFSFSPTADPSPPPPAAVATPADSPLPARDTFNAPASTNRPVPPQGTASNFPPNRNNDGNPSQPARGWQPQPPQQQGKNKNSQPQPPQNKNLRPQKPGKPQPGRQWGNVTLDESVDERAINLGVAFDYETLNQPDGLAALLATAVQPGEPLILDELHAIPANDLVALARSLGCVWKRIPPRRQMLSQILAVAPAAARPIHVTGTLEILDNGNGLLLYLSDDYRVRELSAFVPRQLIRQHGLQRGHEVAALAAAPREGETAPIVVRVDKIMGEDPEVVADWLPFTELTPYYPTQRIFLETDPATATWDNLSMRCVDLLCPIGLGQRGLIVAPPRTGKTILLQGIANAVLKNTPQAHLIVLLVDERPEEVTDFKRQVKRAEVVSSTFDENAESHVHAAEIVIERARRMVEAGRHVIILLDSITRLARAYNTLQPSNGKILSGGVESNALAKPKRFFGSARNIEGGGSLTILGTALVETGSKMDEVIFEEFKGTGNMELDLDRDLANKRIFPAISFERSGTRKEELLYHPDELQKIYALRRAMKGVPSADAMEQLIARIKKTKTNVEFLLTLGR